MTDVPETPAALASLSAMRGLLKLLNDKGLLGSGEIVGMLHDVEGEASSDPLANIQLHSAFTWLREPHLVGAVRKYSKKISGENSN